MCLFVCRPQEGLFGLREWIEEGFFPDGWVGPIDGLGLAPFKKRNSSKTPKSSASGSAGRSSRARTRLSTSDVEEGEETEEADDDWLDDDEETEEEVDTEEEDHGMQDARPSRAARGAATPGGRGRGRGAARSAVAVDLHLDVHHHHRHHHHADDGHGGERSPLLLLGEVARAVSGKEEDEYAERMRRISTGDSGKRRKRPSGLLLVGGPERAEITAY